MLSLVGRILSMYKRKCPEFQYMDHTPFNSAIRSFMKQCPILPSGASLHFIGIFPMQYH